MTRRSFAIRFFLTLCLLLGTCALAKKELPAQPVNINTANSEQLQTVPGIGSATAENAPIRSLEDKNFFDVGFFKFTDVVSPHLERFDVSSYFRTPYFSEFPIVVCHILQN
jgi:hypothetical protein